jgi:integrase
MSVDLHAACTQYLAARRARGYRLADHDWLIASFLEQLAAHGQDAITVAEALVFAGARPGTHGRWHVARLNAIRGFAAHVHALDPAAAEVIPAGLITARVTRRTPYLYSPEQIQALMSAATTISAPLIAASIHTLIGLLAATGLRSGEALALDLDAFSSDPPMLTVTGKYARVRLVPLHHSTVDAITDYLSLRAALTGRPATGALLVGARGGPLNKNTARAAFRRIASACELPPRPGCGPARLHDLRHVFAVNSLIDAHRDGQDIDARIAALANYLGHVSPANTYWYLSASAELMSVVSDRISIYQSGRRS